ncbi:MAG: tRNA 2-selenouridine(34) synthase MnmH [Rhodobacterales bacterium]|nr:tRNA 2-selenouridine(34) synthase MnmH [Rhodobacterales bacterium]
MTITFSTLGALLNHGFDTVIDVRSPAEFAEDHIPGAISLPAMSNEERARVGTIYKHESPFAARKTGAAIVARNVATHLDGPLSDHDGGWRPLVYCWRGGQRSGSVATILSQIGWRTETITGGYRSYRRLVQTMLYEMPIQHRLVLIDGNTGSAKTDVLHRLAARGLQVIDLEGMAAHRGSMLGGSEAGQPRQKAFESALAAALAAFDPAHPVLVEAESSKVGRINIPPSLWSAMCAAPRIEIAAPIDARTAYLTKAYADVIAEPARIERLFQPLRAHRGHSTVDGWISLLRAGNHEALARALMTDHYDAAYAKSRAVHPHQILATLTTDRLDTDGQNALADAIMAIVA